MAGSEKSRYWVAVLYPQNMIEDWESSIGDTVQVPYAYCIHNKDEDTEGKHRDDHVHLLLAFPNTTTYNHALSVFKELGEKACNTCKRVISVRKMYDYLIHDTEDCRKKKKHLYDADERITGNNFDIGAYEQLNKEDKDSILKELISFCLNEEISNMADFWVLFMQRYGDDTATFEVATERNSILRSVTVGVYQKKRLQAEQKRLEIDELETLQKIQRKHLETLYPARGCSSSE